MSMCRGGSLTENGWGTTEKRTKSSGLCRESQRSRMCVVLSFAPGQRGDFPMVHTDLAEVPTGAVSVEHTDPRSRTREHVGASDVSWATWQEFGEPL